MRHPIRWRGAIGALCTLVVVVLSTVGVPSFAGAMAPAGTTSQWQIISTFASTSVNDISCPAPGTCLAVATTGNGVTGSDAPGEVLITTNGGTSWQTVSAPFQAVGLTAIDCPTKQVCLAGGGMDQPDGDEVPMIAYTGNGGSTWTLYPVAGNQGSVSGISCPTTQVCQVSWLYINDVNQTVPPPAYGGLARVSGRGSDIHVEFSYSTDGPNTGGLFSDVDCPSTDVCEAAALSGQSVLFRTTDGGAHWNAQGRLAGVTFPNSIWCTSILHCVVSGVTPGSSSPVAVTRTGGASWSPAILPPGAPDQFGSVTCLDSASCESAAGPLMTGSPSAYGSTDGGATWTDQGIPAGVAIGPMSCGSSSRCFATGAATGGSGVVLAATLPPGPLGTVTSGLPGGTVGMAYQAQLQAAGGTAPYTWSLAAGALPPGLHLSAQGLLSGTPEDTPSTTGVKTSSFTARVTASHGATATVPLQITVQSPSTLHANQTLSKNGSLLAGAYHLTMQADGNLVEYRGTTPIWSTGTGGHPNARLTMQGDGNLVLYDPAGHALWATGTPGHPGATLRLQASDGNLVVYAPNGTPLWASGT